MHCAVVTRTQVGSQDILVDRLEKSYPERIHASEFAQATFVHTHAAMTPDRPTRITEDR